MMRLVTSLTGRMVGKDAIGNIYYEKKKISGGDLRRRRWVMYAGELEASTIPPEWHAWLHYTTDAPLPENVRRAWQKPHEPNLTGTPLGYRPPGSDYLGGKRPPAPGDYESWTPGS
ncbi:NADH:ubiquinone oxidoreductase subunit NDUFA12 [Acidisphaera sp. L21]|uniref:NADH:ubiquinone oxidoreductase subunit NDUFA12 n=1 Tax=Acidisphaera sp. L21 TaxID=1641851 RepID=UPI0038D118B4